MEDVVYNLITSTMNDEKFISRVAKQYAEIYNAKLKKAPTLKILKKQLMEVDKKLYNITEAICNGIYNNLTQTKW